MDAAIMNQVPVDEVELRTGRRGSKSIDRLIASPITTVWNSTIWRSVATGPESPYDAFVLLEDDIVIRVPHLRREGRRLTTGKMTEFRKMENAGRDE
jgi:hypothetical protein